MRMSQQPVPPPDAPEPTSPAPPASPPTDIVGEKKTGAAQPQDNVAAIQQTLQQTWTKVQPVLVVQSIQILRATVQLLNAAVTKLEAIAPEGSVPAENAIGKRLQPIWTRVQEIWVGLEPQRQKLWQWWLKLLQLIRPRLPEALRQPLASDKALTAAIAAVLIIFFWLVSAITPDQPRVATKPSPAQPKVTVAAKSPQPIAVKPVPVVSPVPVVKPVTPASPQPVVVSPAPIAVAPKPAPSGSASSALKAPIAKAPVASPSPTVSPSPAVAVAPGKPIVPPAPKRQLSPEQALLADLQNQFSKLVDRYATGIVDTVQVNPKSSQISLELGGDWYKLSSSEQDGLAKDVLKRAQELKFSKLAIVDQQDHLLVRNPVVGSEPIVLRRQLS
jgi:hypothetical protein